MNNTNIKTTTEGLVFEVDGQQIRGDFSKNLKRLIPNNLGAEMLIKAAKPKAVYEKMGLDYADFLTPGNNSNDVNIPNKDMPLAIDATAGLGEDSLLLAAAGFRVRMYERDEIIASLLKDALQRASEDDRLSNIVSRMELKEEDSITALTRLKEKTFEINCASDNDRNADSVNYNDSDHISVIFLDPMFPERNKTGMVKKKFQLIHVLEKPCVDEEELFNAALCAKPDKIIVKRPAKAPFLSGKKPSYQICGKVIRYDVYVNT